MWKSYYSVIDLNEAVNLLAQHGAAARIVAGATDLILELERGGRKGIEVLIDISRVPGQDRIWLDGDGRIHLGPLVTHNQCAASELLQERAFPLARAAWEVGAPQIRNRGTIAGNLITASPANDTITPLVALGASLTLRSTAGERTVTLASFYTGVRRTTMRPEELLVDISFPAMPANTRGHFIKLGLRRAQAISVVNAAVMLGFSGQLVESAVITLGAVAPSIIRASQAELYLQGRSLDTQTIEQAARLASNAASPIDDLRGSAAYRTEMVRVAVLRLLRALAAGQERQGFPADPVLLAGAPDPKPALAASACHSGAEPIVTTINGQPYRFTSGYQKTLLRLLREDAGLVGTKEGCAEGECGACTIFLDGEAVMACMVPAPRAQGAQIVTIEGLAHDGHLHPVQQAFIDEGAVQCGYCTPGLIMAAARLLEERPQPSHAEIQQAVTGNLCRCTGYYSIVKAIEKAAARSRLQNP